MIVIAVTDRNYAENDQLFPDEVRDYAQKHFTDQKIEHEIKTYPGVPHGTSSTVQPPVLR